jgi:hypothetical protein
MVHTEIIQHIANSCSHDSMSTLQVPHCTYSDFSMATLTTLLVPHGKYSDFSKHEKLLCQILPPHRCCRTCRCRSLRRRCCRHSRQRIHAASTPRISSYRSWWGFGYCYRAIMAANSVGALGALWLLTPRRAP